MYEQLIEMYTNEKRYEDLHDVLYKTGKLEEALEIALTNNIAQSSTSNLDSEILQLLDFI